MRTISAAASALLVLAAVACADAPASAPAAPPAPTLTTPAGKYQTAWLSLDGPGGGCPVFVALRDGKPVQFWSTRVQLPGGIKPSGQAKLLTDALHGGTDGGKLTAVIDLRLVSVWAPMRRLGLMTLTLDLTVADGKANGTWSLKNDGADVAKGGVSGTVRTDTEAGKADAIAPGQDWPSFYGAVNARRAPAYGKPLVDDLSAARPMWRSEAVPLCCWGNGVDARYRTRAAFGTLCGGASSPVVANGVIYLYSYVPSGDVQPEGEVAADLEKYKDNAFEQESMRRYFSKRADVVVTAMDGATGKTLWQSTWPMKQGNYQTHKWRGLNPAPAVGGGVIVVADYSWGLHAYDCKTGELKWSTGGGGVVQGNGASTGAVICGNVVVFATPGRTLGLDIATGKELWKAPGGQSARRVTIGGKDRVLVVGKSLALLDPVSGKVLCTSDAPDTDSLATGAAMPVCEGDAAVFYGTTGADKQAGVVIAYKLSDTAIAKAWTSEPVTWDENLVMAIANNHVYVAGKAEGLRCLDLATGKTLKAIEALKCGSNASLVCVDDRLIYQAEGQHGGQRVQLVDGRPASFAALGGEFHPPHNVTTAYGVMALSNVIVDGRLIIRGMDGIYCYDLRKPAQ